MTPGAENADRGGDRGSVKRRVVWIAWITLLLVGLTVAWAIHVYQPAPPAATKTSSTGTDLGTLTNLTGRQPKEAEPEASHEKVVELCAACHAYPPPELFAREQWPDEVTRGFGFFNQAKLKLKGPVPSAGSVTAYYQSRAPEALPVLERPIEPTPFPVQFERTGFREEGMQGSPSIANVQFLHLSDAAKVDVVACDMQLGMVLRLKPYEPSPKLEVICNLIPHPAHAEVVDLDRDGINDLLIANLGSPIPTEQRLGSVVWLRGSAGGTFAPITLADDVGRVADVQAADFDGDGDLDLVAAVFGRLTLGEVLYYENQTTDWSHPVFARTLVDSRHGAIHVPVTDLNGDGRPDFVALISQEHEEVVAFLNTGPGKFEPHVIYAAPHPAFGSSGIQLTDLDRDGDLDVLLTNGDVLDTSMLRPYHGVRWLENRGAYPFEEHFISALYGVHRAVAADFDGDGDLDIAATTFLPGPFYAPLREEMKIDSVLIFEQTSPGTFVRHSLESVSCDHTSCDAADYDGDGKIDLVIANFFTPLDKTDPNAVVLWRNLGTKPATP